MTREQAIQQAHDAVYSGFEKTEIHADDCKVTAYRVGTHLIRIDILTKVEVRKETA